MNRFTLRAVCAISVGAMMLPSATADQFINLDVKESAIVNSGFNVTASTQAQFNLYRENAAAIYRMERYNTSANNYSVADILATSASGVTSMRFRVGTIANRTSSPPVVLTIDDAGQVAVGTSVARATLHVRQNTTDSAGLRIQNDEGWMELSSDGSDVTFTTRETGGTGPFDIFTVTHSTQKVAFLGDTTSVKVLEIEGGSDLSERFNIDSATVEPGMVVSIDPTKPGALQVSGKAYDRTVAGIVSGAGGVDPGMLMGQPGTLAFGDHPVALSGRVYCLVDATEQAITPGDLLTTSNTPGHAMAVTDHAKAQGAIIGKAMTPLAKGEKGLVLVLVSLQ